jgi:two-component system KDP operon response regulator KdpE
MTIAHPARSATISGRTVQIPRMEFNLLWELASNAGCIMSHEVLIEQVWGHRSPQGDSILRTTIKNLRRRLDDDARSPRYIFTVKKAGYRMGLQRG